MQDAEPPIDYDSPYSKLPSNVVLARVKKNVEKSMTFRNKSHIVVWKQLFDTEHANAIISDGFWYVICKVFKKGKQSSNSIASGNSLNSNTDIQKPSHVLAVSKPLNEKSVNSYEAYEEFLLDRIAANYVSFTILEDEEIVNMSDGNNTLYKD